MFNSRRGRPGVRAPFPSGGGGGGGGFDPASALTGIFTGMVISVLYNFIWETVYTYARRQLYQFVDRHTVAGGVGRTASVFFISVWLLLSFYSLNATYGVMGMILGLLHSAGWSYAIFCVYLLFTQTQRRTVGEIASFYKAPVGCYPIAAVLYGAVLMASGQFGWTSMWVNVISVLALAEGTRFVAAETSMGRQAARSVRVGWAGLSDTNGVDPGVARRTAELQDRPVPVERFVPKPKEEEKVPEAIYDDKPADVRSHWAKRAEELERQAKARKAAGVKHTPKGTTGLGGVRRRAPGVREEVSDGESTTDRGAMTPSSEEGEER